MCIPWLALTNTFFHRIIIANLVGMYVGFQIYKYLVFGPLVKYAVEDLPDEEEEEDFTPFFIPLIGTTKQLKPVPYRGTDPEWKEFIKFSKDHKQAQNVRGRSLSGLGDNGDILTDLQMNLPHSFRGLLLSTPSSH